MVASCRLAITKSGEAVDELMAWARNVVASLGWMADQRASGDVPPHTRRQHRCRSTISAAAEHPPLAAEDEHHNGQVKPSVSRPQPANASSREAPRDATLKEPMRNEETTDART